MRGIHQSPVNSPHIGQWRFDVFFYPRLNKRLSKPSRCRWFETPLLSLCRHGNEHDLITVYWLVLKQWASSTGGVRYVIFQYVQFSIRLAVVSYSGKKVRTVVSPAVRSVIESRDTRNCVQNEPKYAICVLLATYLYYKALWIMLCALIWQIRHNYNHLGDDQCDVTGHGKMPALGTAGAMVTTHEISVMMWSFREPKLFNTL